MPTDQTKPLATFTTTYRGKLTDIATIARWLALSGIKPRSRNELINAAVVNFANLLREKFPDTAVLTTTDALKYLEEFELIGKNLKKTQPTVSRELWEESDLITTTETSQDTGLAQKATKQQQKTTAKEVLKLTKLAKQRKQNDNQVMKDLANTAHLPIRKEEKIK